MADIEQWDGHVLEKLMERGSMTVREVMESIESAQLGLPTAQAWVESALERGFIAKTGGSNESTRYNIAAAGRNAASVRIGRFVVSEKAREGEPSRLS
jgi:predicted transcriptional regulator